MELTLRLALAFRMDWNGIGLGVVGEKVDRQH